MSDYTAKADAEAEFWHCENEKREAVEAEKAKWLTAFRAYESALAKPYFDQDLEARKQNDQEVHETFLALKRLAEGV